MLVVGEGDWATNVGVEETGGVGGGEGQVEGVGGEQGFGELEREVEGDCGGGVSGQQGFGCY